MSLTQFNCISFGHLFKVARPRCCYCRCHFSNPLGTLNFLTAKSVRNQKKNISSTERQKKIEKQKWNHTWSQTSAVDCRMQSSVVCHDLLSVTSYIGTVRRQEKNWGHARAFPPSFYSRHLEKCSGDKHRWFHPTEARFPPSYPRYARDNEAVNWEKKINFFFPCTLSISMIFQYLPEIEYSFISKFTTLLIKLHIYWA